MTETTTPRRHLVLTCLLIAIASSILMLASHRPAWADYYSIDRVDIDATLNADSSLQVRETRKFDFGGSFHGVYWKIPEGTYEGREVEASVTGCGIVNPDGTLSEFKKTDSGDDGTYRLSRRDGYQQVKLYSPQEDTTVNFYVTFTYRDRKSVV